MRLLILWPIQAAWRRTSWGRCQHRHGVIPNTWPPMCGACIRPMPTTTED